MFSILTLLIVLTLSILVTRIATVALTHTGLSRQSARFQARSAFTGVGFTTRESEKMVNHPLQRFTRLDVQDYAGMLHLAGEYQVAELQVEPEDWIADHELKDLRLRDEGIMILGITRKSGKYIGAPMGDTRIQAYDTLILYGRVSALTNLDERKQGWGGDYQHVQEVSKQMEVVREQTKEDPAEGEKEDAPAHSAGDETDESEPGDRTE
jgi:Trk K+ transport system NAD-binding subunit